MSNRVLFFALALFGIMQVGALAVSLLFRARITKREILDVSAEVNLESFERCAERYLDDSRRKWYPGTHLQSAAPFCGLVSSRGGLSNRIRTLSGFIMGAALLGGGEIQVQWPINDACEGALEEYFETLHLPTFLGDVSIRSVKNFRAQDLRRDECVCFRGQSPITAVFAHLFNNSDPHHLRLPFPRALYLFSLFRPSAPIQSLIDDFRRMHRWDSTPMLGLHVRRTDLVHHLIRNKGKPDQVTKDESFFAFIDEALKANPSTRFFLATDNLETRQNYTQRYGNDRILFYNSPIAVRDDLAPGSVVRRTSFEHAVIDMWLLSYCDKMKGTFYSSYSSVANYFLQARKILHKMDGEQKEKK